MHMWQRTIVRLNMILTRRVLGWVRQVDGPADDQFDHALRLPEWRQIKGMQSRMKPAIHWSAYGYNF